MTMRLFEHFLAVEGLVANKKSADASGHRRTFEWWRDEGIEPPDLCTTNAALSQLSHTPTGQPFQPQACACEAGIMPEVKNLRPGIFLIKNTPA